MRFRSSRLGSGGLGIWEITRAMRLEKASGTCGMGTRVGAAHTQAAVAVEGGSGERQRENACVPHLVAPQGARLEVFAAVLLRERIRLVGGDLGLAVRLVSYQHLRQVW